MLLLCLIFLTERAYAQTPGLIYKIANNGGNKVLDPNGDGYVSIDPTGFQLNNGQRLDEGVDYSEIPYRPFPIFMDEPLADLKTGGSYGHTDYAPRVYDVSGKPIGSPLASYFDGKNFLFRVRLAGQSTASKGYSILIDTDGQMPGGSPNPGFEFEVVLATNFDVRVLDHRTNTTGGNLIFSGSVDQYSQKSIAGSTGGGDADYFYDFYVPITAFGGAISSTSNLRMTGTTVTSAKSGIFGVASDVGGLDDKAYAGTPIENIWKSIIDNTPVSTPTQIQDSGFTKVTATAPKVSSPIYANSTVIKGSSIEVEGSVITVYRNGTSLGGTTVLADGSWSFSLGGVTLAVNDVITATVKPIEKNLSAVSTAVSVTVIKPCTSTPPKITGTVSGGKGIIFTVYQTGQQEIKIYNNGVQVFAQVINQTTAPASYTYNCATGQCFSAGSYQITSTLTGQCESPKSNTICYDKNIEVINYVPTITTQSIGLNTVSISGTFPVQGTITLVKNGVLISGKTANTTSTVTNWTIDLSGVSLADGDRIWVQATSSANCSSSEISNVVIVGAQSTSPTITGTYCGPTTTVTGTSSEIAGTTIKVFLGSTEVGQTTVNAQGTWTATITSSSSGTLTATATAPNKSVSALSAGKSINALPTNAGLSITGTDSGGQIYEGSTSVRGTITTGSFVTLYINGQAYVNANGEKIYATISGGNFTFANISPFELYAGATLTVTAKSAVDATCESAPSAGYEVACNEVDTSANATFTQAKFCHGTPAFIQLSTSEPGVIYNIYSNGQPFGLSKLGTGSAIILQSAPVVNTGTVVEVRTIKVGADCQSIIGTPMTVELYPEVPRNFTVIATPSSTSLCANYEVTITVQNAETGYSYQLILDNETKDKIGTAITPTIDGQNISFPVLTVNQTTTYGVVITGTSSGCVAENTIWQTISINGGPDVMRSVTASDQFICVGNSTTINISTQSGYTYHIYQTGNATQLAQLTGDGNVQGATLSAPFTTLGTKEFYFIIRGSSCGDLEMNSKVTVEVTNGITEPVYAGADVTIAAATYTLQGSNPAPGSGRWNIVSKPTAATPVFANTANPTTQVSELVSGTYEFSWTVTPGCGGSIVSDNVIIKVNYPAAYSLRSNKLYTDYVQDEVLGSVSDPEGVSSVQHLAAKGALPNGVALNTTTGLLSVSNPNLLEADTYNFTIRVTDLLGGITDIPLTIRFYSPSIRPGDITPLPVELTYFKATHNLSTVLLQWQTASERNNDRFEIERSHDSRTFTTIGNVTGNGNSNQKLNYTFTDIKPLPGKAYYRLRQVDFDGKTQYSKTIAVLGQANLQTKSLLAYPNPFEDKMEVSITTAATEQVILSIYNLQGKSVYRQAILLEGGVANYTLNTTHLPAGIYILRVSGTDFNETVKLLKK